MSATRRRQPVVGKTAIRRAWAALEERGLAVTAARVCANGDILLLTDQGAAPANSEAALDAEIEALIDGGR